jgi:hypothetical protein
MGLKEMTAFSAGLSRPRDGRTSSTFSILVLILMRGEYLEEEGVFLVGIGDDELSGLSLGIKVYHFCGNAQVRHCLICLELLSHRLYLKPNRISKRIIFKQNSNADRNQSK